MDTNAAGGAAAGGRVGGCGGQVAATPGIAGVPDASDVVGMASAASAAEEKGGEEQESSSGLMGPCVACGTPTSKLCGACKVVKYCSSECMRSHRKVHKTFCRALKASAGDGACAGRNHVLLVTGMGACGPEDFYTENARAALKAAGLRVTTYDALEPAPDRSQAFKQIGLALARGRFSACIVLGLGSSGADWCFDFFTAPAFKSQLLEWVRQGGTVLFQGEGRAANTALGWFDKPWTCAQYTRTTHMCNAKGRQPSHWCTWYAAQDGAITCDISVKAVMLDNVPADEMLYGTVSGATRQSLVPMMAGDPIQMGLGAVAFGRYGNGALGFFGDVNAEESTCKIMAVLARGEQQWQAPLE